MRVMSDLYQQLLEAADIGEELVLYMLCDSSPRGGRDWLLSEVFIVSATGLERLVELQDRRLRSLALRAAAAGPAAERCDSDDADDLEMPGLLYHHVLAPVALGVGETAVHQKFTALLHALRLEALYKNACTHLYVYIYICVKVYQQHKDQTYTMHLIHKNMRRPSHGPWCSGWSCAQSH